MKERPIRAIYRRTLTQYDRDVLQFPFNPYERVGKPYTHSRPNESEFLDNYDKPSRFETSVATSLIELNQLIHLSATNNRPDSTEVPKLLKRATFQNHTVDYEIPFSVLNSYYSTCTVCDLSHQTVTNGVLRNVKQEVNKPTALVCPGKSLVSPNFPSPQNKRVTVAIDRDKNLSAVNYNSRRSVYLLCVNNARVTMDCNRLLKYEARFINCSPPLLLKESMQSSPYLWVTDTELECLRFSYSQQLNFCLWLKKKVEVRRPQNYLNTSTSNPKICRKGIIIWQLTRRETSTTLNSRLHIGRHLITKNRMTTGELDGTISKVSMKGTSNNLVCNSCRNRKRNATKLPRRAEFVKVRKPPTDKLKSAHTMSLERTKSNLVTLTRQKDSSNRLLSRRMSFGGRRLVVLHLNLAPTRSSYLHQLLQNRFSSQLTRKSPSLGTEQEFWSMCSVGVVSHHWYHQQMLSLNGDLHKLWVNILPNFKYKRKVGLCSSPSLPNQNL